jgi:hypothetical protein
MPLAFALLMLTFPIERHSSRKIAGNSLPVSQAVIVNSVAGPSTQQ